jgi:hypothetical protein
MCLMKKLISNLRLTKKAQEYGYASNGLISVAILFLATNKLSVATYPLQKRGFSCSVWSHDDG